MENHSYDGEPKQLRFCLWSVTKLQFLSQWHAYASVKRSATPLVTIALMH
ncbi:hypothetical protein EMIT0P260_90085 [Pseudomonas sp. IT-P260]